MTMPVIIVASILLVGCASGPSVITSGEAGRPMAFDCKNIDPEQEAGEFPPDYSYSTTWGSVWSAALRDSTVDIDPISAGTSVLAQMPSDGTYCLVFPDSEQLVSSVVYDTLRNLGVKFALSNPDSGEFVSTTVENVNGNMFDIYLEDPTTKPTSKWQETYYVHVTGNIEGGTDLRVFRDIRISRPFEGEWSRFIRETSNGKKEAWVLLRTDERLAKGDKPPVPPKIGT